MRPCSKTRGRCARTGRVTPTRARRRARAAAALWPVPVPSRAPPPPPAQERWLSKTKRIAQEDFVTAAGRLPFRYPGSVHTGTGYNPPGNLPREVDKTKWVSERTFVGAVPSNRLVSAGDSYGGGDSSLREARDQARMTMSMNASG